jgi:tetraprenyl-beta-curcumene synthase
LSALATLVSEARTAAALGFAQARYWPSVLPRVHRGLRHWEQRAQRIPDPGLKELALAKIKGERFNTEVAATLCTLAPRRYRRQAIDATVALQVMYDYLDGVGEDPGPDPLADGRRLFSAFTVALSPERLAPVDYYEYHSHRQDGGYLEELVRTCHYAFCELPSAAVVAPVACRAAAACGEAQTRTHAIGALGTTQLTDWANAEAAGTGLTWWEYTAAATASVLRMHALIAAAADRHTTSAEARDLDVAYLFIAGVTTLLDSLIDQGRDLEEEGHSFLGYYESEEVKAERVAAIVAHTTSVDLPRVRHWAHHRMTNVGAAAYYLSAPSAREPRARAVKARVVNELPPLIAPTLGIFRLWRLAKAVASKR